MLQVEKERWLQAAERNQLDFCIEEPNLSRTMMLLHGWAQD
jgi:hypothetical protein